MEAIRTTPERRGRPPEGLYRHVSRSYVAAVTGLSRPVVSGILNGRRGISGERLILLAGVLCISPHQLNSDLRNIRAARESAARAKATGCRGMTITLPPSSGPTGAPWARAAGIAPYQLAVAR